MSGQKNNNFSNYEYSMILLCGLSAFARIA